MDVKQLFLIISTIIGLITPLIGIRAIFKGEYKPQRMTRLIFLIISLLFVSTLFAQGDTVAIVLAVIQLITSITIFTLSFKYGMGGYSKTDLLVFICAMITLVVWKTTENPTSALYTSILTDTIGFSPTIIKSFKNPFTEDPKFYLSDTIAGFLNILALKSYMLSELAFPLYIFLVNGLVLGILLIRGRTRSIKVTA